VAELIEVPVTLRLPLDASQLSNATFVEQLSKDIVAVMANALAVPETWVKLLRLRAGSIVADIVVAVPSGSASSVLQQALVTLRVSPDSMLAALKQQYNITEPLTVETAGLPEGSYGPEVSTAGGLSDRDKRVLAGVLVGVGGIFILSALLVAWLWRRRRAAGDGAEGDGSEPSGSGGSVSAEVQGAAARGGSKYAVAGEGAGAAAAAGAAGAVRDQPQLAPEASGGSAGGKGGKGRTRSAAKGGKGAAGAGEGGKGATGGSWNELELVTDGMSEGEHDPRAPAGLRK
jgi:hypothetical protein